MSNNGIREDVDDPRFRTTMPQQMASACTGALLTSLLVTPFDVVKVRLQTQQKTLLSNKCFLYCNGLMDHLCPCLNTTGPGSGIQFTPPAKQFSGTVDAFIKICRSEGFRYLWSGLGPTLVSAVPATIVYFVSYEQLRTFIKDRNSGCLPYWGPLAAGATARIWAVSLVSPLEMIRTKMQSKQISYLEIHQALQTMFRNRGIFAYWRGLGSTLLRDVPFSAIYWLHYEAIKRNFCSSQRPSFAFSFMAGAISGSVAAFITTPFDVVKTHQQIDLGEKEIFTGKRKKTHQNFVTRYFLGEQPFLSAKDSPKRGSTMLDVMRQIYNRSGVRGLFSGLAPRLVKVAPACAIMISTFEYGNNFFRTYNAQRTSVREDMCYK